jgi:hypothetical protein
MTKAALTDMHRLCAIKERILTPAACLRRKIVNSRRPGAEGCVASKVNVAEGGIAYTVSCICQPDIDVTWLP